MAIMLCAWLCLPTSSDFRGIHSGSDDDQRVDDGLEQTQEQQRAAEASLDSAIHAADESVDRVSSPQLTVMSSQEWLLFCFCSMEIIADIWLTAAGRKAFGV